MYNQCFEINKGAPVTKLHRQCYLEKYDEVTYNYYRCYISL